MNHLDLFSGIGGFALAVDRVWPNSTHIFCDNDLFCQQVLKKHWPNSKIYGDIRTITYTDWGKQGAGRRNNEEVSRLPQEERQPEHSSTLSWGGDQLIDLLTGGFPCQPFSQAGRRKGTEDDRYLWPEMFRVIQLTKPKWVIAENVGGFVTWNEGMVLEQVCLDLENQDYEVQPFIIPAVSVNAPHRRDRVWFVAYRKGINEKRWNKRQGKTQPRRGDWSKDWTEVAARLCRVDDGLHRRLDRNPRLKALGNAIVPQVAEEIMKAIDLSNRET